jgi:hypothetical protein
VTEDDLFRTAPRASELDDPERFGWSGPPAHAIAYAAAIRDVKAFLAADVHGTAERERVFQAQLDVIAAQLEVIRGLCELLTTWAGVRDRPDEPIGFVDLGPTPTPADVDRARANEP